MISTLKLAIAGGVIATLVASHTYAFYQGRKVERAAMLKAAIKAYETREAIDDDIASDDPVALCRRLGGLPDECDGLRGVP
jgi:hypothetical protein